MYPQCPTWIVLTSLLWAGACASREADAPPGARFVAVGPAVARDVGTGLEWTRHDDGVGRDWHKADAYCQSLSIDDAAGWRLPSIEELRRLYGGTTRVQCGDEMCVIDPVFTLTSPYVWSATQQAGPNARTYLDFRFGTELSPSITPRLVRSVLCVRTSSS